MLLSSSVAMLCMDGEMDIKEDISTFVESEPPSLLQYAYNTGQDPCSYCHNIILDQTVLLLEGQPYHPQCLNCTFCLCSLGAEPTCFIKDGLIVCRQCYRAKFRRCCEKCGQGLTPEDFIMRARDSIFHVHCFCCYVCGMKLNVGEFFVMNERGELFCNLHSEQHNLSSRPDDNVKIREPSEENEDYAEEEPSSNSRSKRMRTSFKHHQLKAMKIYFSLNHNPDAKDLKQLAQKTGLTKRVLQVWFQNARAKYRRSMQGREGHSISPPTMTTSMNHLAEVQSSSSTHSSDYLSTSPNEYESH